ncbi:protein kinase domain-containing protein [Sorangium sp. So ce1097]|uniref:serine/threonine-protein kinase n=1 Tax=Sorangium sp. So ce1097 TaxID=3133330 RepID=UPI003F60FEF5
MNAPFQPAVGMLFGEFRIVRPLSAGGMGAVYVAEQASTGKLRALKLMHPQLCADVRLRERFEQEARVGALVESDHVVQVIGAGVDQASGVPWIAMELLDGEDLSVRLRRCGLLSPQDTYEIFRQLCHALGAAHRAGVVHRDMKPQNIFLAKRSSATAPWSVKVLDFGIARVAAEANTMATASLGTPLWMAPEQTEARGQIAPATDVWALGLIAFVMLTGRMYWRAANDPMGTAMPVLLREILIEPIDPASVRATALGRAGCIVHPFDAWFARCVARDPAQRFSTAQEAFDALGPALFADPRLARTTVSGAPPASETAPGSAAPGSAAPGSAAPGSAAPNRAGVALTPAGSRPPPSLSGPAGMSVDTQRPPSARRGARGPASLGAEPASSPAEQPRPAASVPPGSAPATAGSAPAEGPRRQVRWGPVLLACSLLGGATAAALAYAAGRAPGEVARAQRLPALARAAVASAGRGDDARAPAAASVEETAPAPAHSATPLLQPKAPRAPREGAAQAAATPGAAATPAAAATPGAAATPAAAATPGAAARPFDHAAAHAALQQKGATARVHCKGKAGPKAVSARVFFNPTGGVQRISVDPRVAMTPAGTCVQMVLGSARVPAFDGTGLQEVSTTVAIE